MGTDIHNHIEYFIATFKGFDENHLARFEKRWFCGDYFKISPNNNEYEVIPFCEESDYKLFAMLANVRNANGLEYISEPRGLPTDVTDIVSSDFVQWGKDAQDASYVTLRELLDFKVKVPYIKHKGMITERDARALDTLGSLPCNWSTDSSRTDLVYREWESDNYILDDLIEALKQRAAELDIIEKSSWEREPEVALSLAKHIRLVFWFDN